MELTELCRRTYEIITAAHRDALKGFARPAHEHLNDAQEILDKELATVQHKGEPMK